MILRVHEEFDADWRSGRPARLELIFDSSRPLASGTTIARVRGLLDAYDQTVGTLRLIARGIHPAVATPLQVAALDVATPESRFDLAQQLLPYLLLLLAFIGGMQLAIDATAGERERQSLEPLLATPVSREIIISAKILATAVFTLLSIAVTLVAFALAFTLVPMGEMQASINIAPAALARLFLIILPIVLLGATLLTALAAFARSYREAQGYLPLLMFLPMVPTLLLLVAPVKTQLWMLAVPFLGQNQLILRVLRGESIALPRVAGESRLSLPAGRHRMGGRGAALSSRTTGGIGISPLAQQACAEYEAGRRRQDRWIQALRRAGEVTCGANWSFHAHCSSGPATVIDGRLQPEIEQPGRPALARDLGGVKAIARKLVQPASTAESGNRARARSAPKSLPRPAGVPSRAWPAWRSRATAAPGSIRAVAGRRRKSRTAAPCVATTRTAGARFGQKPRSAR